MERSFMMALASGCVFMAGLLFVFGHGDVASGWVIAAAILYAAIYVKDQAISVLAFHEVR